LQEHAERIAIAEEKRLKAALTAKRDPNPSMASPAIGHATNSEVIESKPPNEDPGMSMVVDPASQSQKDEVGVILRKTIRNSWLFQSPWIQQLEALFEDVKKIAPGNSYEVIG